MNINNKKIAIVTLGGNDGILSLTKEIQKRGHVCDIISSAEYKNDSQYDIFLNILLKYDLIYFRVLANKTFSQKLLNDLKAHDKIIVNSNYLKEMELSSKVFQMKLAQSIGVQVPNFKEFLFKDINIEEIKKFTKLPAILKASIGIAGRSVYLITSESDLNTIEFNFDKKCVIQDFIAYKRDLRVFVINGKIWGVMERRPGDGDFKANISQGGSGHVVEDTSLVGKAEELIKNLDPIFKVEIAGYDFLETKAGDLFFLEINANPGWKGLDTALNTKTAVPVADYIESLF